MRAKHTNRRQKGEEWGIRIAEKVTLAEMQQRVRRLKAVRRLRKEDRDAGGVGDSEGAFYLRRVIQLVISQELRINVKGDGYK